VEALAVGRRTQLFGTRVPVTNPAINQAVEATVNDRGPKTTQHLINLTPAAAWGDLVRVEVLHLTACEAQSR
jgi:rare lipoprotein A (peptidoglycan hydrolase)